MERLGSVPEEKGESLDTSLLWDATKVELLKLCEGFETEVETSDETIKPTSASSSSSFANLTEKYLEKIEGFKDAQHTKYTVMDK